MECRSLSDEDNEVLSSKDHQIIFFNFTYMRKFAIATMTANGKI